MCCVFLLLVGMLGHLAPGPLWFCASVLLPLLSPSTRSCGMKQEAVPCEWGELAGAQNLGPLQ